MLVLAFDTSSPAVTVAVAAVEHSTAPEVALLATATEIATNRHGELLAPLISDVLDRAAVAVADLAAIAVGLGPGPFTGLRVGIVTAKAMADALSIPTYGESSLRLLAPPGRGVATNARRKQVYWAITDADGFSAGPDISTPELAAERFAVGGVATVAGEGPLLYAEAFAGFSHRDDETYPQAQRLLSHIAQRASAGVARDDLMPMYLRRPDAQPPGAPKKVTPA